MKMTNQVSRACADLLSDSQNSREDDNAAIDSVRTTRSGARLAQERFHRSHSLSRREQKKLLRKRSRANQTAKTARKADGFLSRHGKMLIPLAAIALLLTFLLGTFSSCSMLMESAGTAVVSSTYPSRDADMLGAEEVYAEKEALLQQYLNEYESSHDYDEYRFVLDEIGHDPYVLISFLTADREGEWRLSEVQGTLQMLFDLQYKLTEEVVKETRYRTETRVGTRTVVDPVTGEKHMETYRYTVQVPYDYFICTVTLRNADLSHLPVVLLDEDHLALYAVYMATLGNRPDLFSSVQYPHASVPKEYLDYTVPAEALTDEKFAAMLAEAEKYLGFPYVWGGSTPSTSFDCSGYVSWVINHSGWDVGRLSANGLHQISTEVSAEAAKPGDLIFFRDTYAGAEGISHVGIYVGDQMMLHCGNPISYAPINTDYWRGHFDSFARLP